MRIWQILALAASLRAEPLSWAELPSALTAILIENGLSAERYGPWRDRRTRIVQDRLAAGAAEHIAYFLLQTKSLGTGAPLDPPAEARRYLESLPLPGRKTFLAGDSADYPFSAPVRRRMDAFWNLPPVSPRHRLLREMDARLGWTPERVVQTAFRFLMQRSASGDAGALYQSRGLSADPYPPSMRAVEWGLAWIQANRAGPRAAVLLAGPGAELGSRFGVDDAKPVVSPQPAALLALLPVAPTAFDCVDIRPEVAASLASGPCRAATLDLVAGRLPREQYDLAVATNLLVYLDDTELALALANFAQSLRPGGCLLHNDARFAARLFGEAAGIPAVRFEPVPLGRRGGREQLDRMVIHCKTP